MVNRQRKNKQVLENELSGILAWMKQEQENGVNFSDLNKVPWDKTKKIVRALEIEKELKRIASLEEKARKAIQRNDLSKVKQEILSAHSDSCDVCLMDNVFILEIHHIVPIENKGTNKYDNLAVLCPNCHAMVHKMKDSFQRNESSGMDKWISENYSTNAKDRLLKLFFDYIKKS